MTTPTRQPIGEPLQNLAPSASFLQQLLQEINGSGTPTALREPPSSQGTPRTSTSSNESRRASLVWSGGASIAQEARKQLRASDEARLHRTSVVVRDGSPNVPRATLALYTPCFDSSSSSGQNSSSVSPDDAHVLGVANYPVITQRTSSEVSGAPQSKTAMGDLRPGASAFDAQLPFADVISRTTSPLIFCDIDSDISATPSPTEPPTSALSTAPTDATSLSQGRPRTPSTSGSRSPEKRPRSTYTSSQLLSKKTRTTTLPTVRTVQRTQPVAQCSSWRNGIGTDNRSLIREFAFTERSPTLLEQVGSFGEIVSPELSSFRPEAAGPQGVPTSIRRSSAIELDSSPESDDTPIYARSLHLVDTDISIYKKMHGDEWRDNSLCLHCFRLHGNFSKLTLYGYEVCGRNEALESHYWDSDGCC